MWGIDTSTKEGKMLVSALAIISTECRPDKTPEDIISELKEMANNL